MVTTTYHHRRRQRLSSSSSTLSWSLIRSALFIIGFCLYDDKAIQNAVHAAAVKDSSNGEELSDIKCFSGWTAPLPSSSTEEEIENLQQAAASYIPKSWINDGYCDCPFGDSDGGNNDEPNTNACSGSKSWPGVDTSHLPQETNNNNIMDDVYVCPEQPKLKLPLSRIHDGICDCCDGSDEFKYTICPNNCNEILKEEREHVAKIKHSYMVGSRQRDIDIDTFQKLRSQKLLDIDAYKVQLLELESNILPSIMNSIRDHKQKYVQSRIIAMKDIVVSNQLSIDILSGIMMSNELLEQFIIHVCQISGELMMADTDNEFSSKIPNDDIHKNSCSPLRVAALDLGFTWNAIEEFDTDNNDNNNDNGINGQVNMTGEMIQIIYDNAMDAVTYDDDGKEMLSSTTMIPSLRWTKSKAKSKRKPPRKGGRRLDEDEDPIYDDDYMMDKEYEHDNMMMDDDLYNDRDRDLDYPDDYDHLSSSSRGRKDNEDEDIDNENESNDDNDDNDANVDDDETSKEKEYLNDLLQNQLRLFSKITQRTNYLLESETIIQKINQILDSPPLPLPSSDDDDDEQKNGNDHDKKNLPDTNGEEKEEEEEEEGTTTSEGEDEDEDEDEDTADVVDDEKTVIADETTSAVTTEDNSSFDPNSYRMVRNELRNKQQIIQNGLRWSASAKLLFDSSKDNNANDDNHFSFSDDDLKRLAIGTLFYGQISSLQVWQILISILEPDNASDDDDNNGTNTCSSPWSENCPPKQIVLNNNDEDNVNKELGSLLYPPSFIIDVAKVFCDEEGLKFAGGSSSAASCGSNNNNDDEENNIVSFVSNYNNKDEDEESSFLYNFGYTVPVRRNYDGSDPLQSIFKSIIELPIDIDGLHQLEESKKSKEDEIKDINKSINDTWKEIGGTDGNELGRDGEIWTIADKCFDITAGKYTYEVCLFGKALQKEGSNKGGTNLGQWTGIEYENNDNDNGDGDGTDGEDDNSIRVMKWENGAKCWNGPKRSATVYMKCGIDHKIISADEPDTCRYVFEMESYLACDDSYKLRAGLL